MPLVTRARDHRGRPLWIVGRRPRALGPDAPILEDDWRLARPAEIRRALERALARPSGGWYAVDAPRRIPDAPTRHVLAGEELVSWRTGGELRFAPAACPHMGGPLHAGVVRDGCLVCPWHGLRLDGRRVGPWSPLPVHDDGVLAWVRLGPPDPAAPRPPLAERPGRFVAGVLRHVARCDPADVIANRLDPWHGAHLHGHSFARLRVVDRDDDRLRCRVAFRILGRVCVEVDCSFHAPGPRTVVMTILDGEGTGSVVETHATPIGPGETAIVEATLASSPRRGFDRALRLAGLIRPLLERAARRLWVDDAAYAERTYALRARGEAAWAPPRLVEPPGPR